MYAKPILTILGGFAVTTLLALSAPVRADEVRSGHDANVNAGCACCAGTEVAKSPKHTDELVTKKREALPLSEMGSNNWGNTGQ
jgi:hypothetical protein